MSGDTDEIEIIDGEDEEVGETEFAEWWARLPDFIKPEYPFDLPPDRLPFAQFVFTKVGAARVCPEIACNRSGACRGGDGPPCFRADRKNLQQVLFLWWMTLYHGCTDEDYAASLRGTGNPYAPQDDPPQARPRRGRR